MPSDSAAPGAAPADLEKAGRMLEDAVKAMRDQNIAPQFVASALLGAALHILSRTVPEDAIIRILTNAIAGVKAGHLRQPQG
jgi:hypothetical protein